MVHLVQHPVLHSKHFILVIDLDWNQSKVESYLQIFIEFNFLEWFAVWYSTSVGVHQAHYSNFPEKLWVTDLGMMAVLFS